MNNYVVWVGGVEVNDHYLPWAEAYALGMKFRADGYTDVVIEILGTDK
jgi:hypothetical protein